MTIGVTLQKPWDQNRITTDATGKETDLSVQCSFNCCKPSFEPTID